MLLVDFTPVNSNNYFERGRIAKQIESELKIMGDEYMVPTERLGVAPIGFKNSDGSVCRMLRVCSKSSHRLRSRHPAVGLAPNRWFLARGLAAWP